MDLQAHVEALPTLTMTVLARAALGSADAEAGTWRCRALGGGLGVASAGVFRVEGLGRVADAPAPWSLVLKVLRPPAPGSPTAPMERDERHLLYWRREALAYASGVLHDLPDGLAAPRCYGVVERPDDTVWLWLEDLRGCVGWPWAPERYAPAARDLGRFAGAYAAGRPQPAAPWLCTDQPAGWFERFARATATALRPDAWDHPLVRAAVPVSVRDRVRRLIGEREAFRRGLARLPRVLCHHDVWSRNLFARHGAGRAGTVAVDWASVGTGPVGADGGTLLAGSMGFGDLDPAAAAREEPLVFEAYLAGLREAGWHGDGRLARLGYTASAALLWGLPTWLPLIPTEQGRAFLEGFLGRPIGESLERWAAMLDLLLDLGDEARALLGKLP